MLEAGLYSMAGSSSMGPSGAPLSASNSFCFSKLLFPGRLCSLGHALSACEARSSVLCSVLLSSCCACTPACGLSSRGSAGCSKTSRRASSPWQSGAPSADSTVSGAATPLSWSALCAMAGSDAAGLPLRVSPLPLRRARLGLVVRGWVLEALSLLYGLPAASHSSCLRALAPCDADSCSDAVDCGVRSTGPARPASVPPAFSPESLRCHLVECTKEIEQASVLRKLLLLRGQASNSCTVLP